MRRVLITGASGFVGANLARRLLENGDAVYTLLRVPEGNWRLEEIESRLAAIHVRTIHTLRAMACGAS